MLAVLTSKQISEWQAYDRLDPVGEWRREYGIAFLSSLIVNIAIKHWGKKDAKLTAVDDFLFEWDEAKIEQRKLEEAEKMKKILLSIVEETNREKDKK